MLLLLLLFFAHVVQGFGNNGIGGWWWWWGRGRQCGEQGSEGRGSGRGESDNLIENRSPTFKTDVCSSQCTLTPGFGCDDGSASAGISLCRPICGDGLVVKGESCDDGNTISGDGCSSTCQLEKNWQCSRDPIKKADVCTCAPWQYGSTCSIYCQEMQSCGGHGQCDTTFGTCICDATWFTTNCSQFVTPLFHSEYQVSPLGKNFTIDYFGKEGVWVPPSALTTAQLLSVDLYDGSVLPPTQGNRRHVSTIKDYSPHGLKFKIPATLWMRFNATSLYNQDSSTWSSNLGLFYYNDTQQQWTPVVPSWLDAPNNAFVGYINHFSKYSIIETFTIATATPAPTKISAVVIMGIVVGIVCFIILVVASVYIFSLSRRHSRRKQLQHIRKYAERAGLIPTPGSIMDQKVILPPGVHFRDSVGSSRNTESDRMSIPPPPPPYPMPFHSSVPSADDDSCSSCSCSASDHTSCTTSCTSQSDTGSDRYSNISFVPPPPPPTSFPYPIPNPRQLPTIPQSAAC